MQTYTNSIKVEKKLMGNFRFPYIWSHVKYFTVTESHANSFASIETFRLFHSGWFSLSIYSVLKVRWLNESKMPINKLNWTQFDRATGGEIFLLIENQCIYRTQSQFEIHEKRGSESNYYQLCWLESNFRANLLTTKNGIRDIFLSHLMKWNENWVISVELDTVNN